VATNLEQYAVGWGALALINANLAQLKGRSGFWWFVGSMIGGPVITFLLALTESEPTASRGEG
jgi:hypothetical protein